MSLLYDEILAIAREYMGIAAEDYIRRRIRIVQSGLTPEHIRTERLERLVAGIDMTAKVYMSAEKVDAFRRAILALRDKHPERAESPDADRPEVDEREEPLPQKDEDRELLEVSKTRQM